MTNLTKIWCVGIITVVAAMIFLVHTENNPGEGISVEVATATAAPTRVQKIYSEWKTQHERMGGDHNVVIPMGFSKGFSDEALKFSGHVRIDLIEGQVEATAAGPLTGADLWLVDNAPGKGAMVDPEDRLLYVGPLSKLAKHDGIETTSNVLSVSKELGGIFEDFDVDLVALTKPGVKPGVGPDLAYGAPRTFQRMYTANRKGEMATYAENFRVNVKGQEIGLSNVLSSVAHADNPLPVDPDVLTNSMVALGAKLFIEEEFDGNGRTCNSCHPMANNTTLDVGFINSLPTTDPLFVAENNPALANLEKPHLMRQFGLILENVDGFSNPGVMRSVPHTLALSISIRSPRCVDPAGCFLPPNCPTCPPQFFGYGQVAPSLDVGNVESSGFSILPDGSSFPNDRTGWGGDGAPGDGSLRSFAIGAVVQHAPKTLNRVAGVDFRLPTDAELDAMELFQLSLGRLEDPPIRDMVFLDNEVIAGRDIFVARDTQFGQVQAGKCTLCHQNAGSNQDAQDFGAIIAPLGLTPHWEGNQNFPTGIELVTSPAKAAFPSDVPRDGGFGIKSLNGLDCSSVAFGFDPATGGPTFFPTGAPGPGGFGIQGSTAFTFPMLSPQGTDPTQFPGQCLIHFNVPPLVEAADTAPFFHQNNFATLEESVQFYTSPEFNDDPGITLFLKLNDSAFKGIELTDQSVERVGKFLRVLNTLENLRSSIEFAQAAKYAPAPVNGQLPAHAISNGFLDRALQELGDIKPVLNYTSNSNAISLHTAADGYVDDAISLLGDVQGTTGVGARNLKIDTALEAMENARRDLIYIN